MSNHVQIHELMQEININLQQYAEYALKVFESKNCFDDVAYRNKMERWAWIRTDLDKINGIAPNAGREFEIHVHDMKRQIDEKYI